MHQRLVILVNNPKQSLHARNSFRNKHFERGLWGSGTSDQSLFRLQNKFRKITFLAIYYLTKFEDII